MSDEVQIIAFEAAVDLASAANAVDAAIDRGCRRLIINLRTLRSIDSYGLALLIHWQKHVTEQAGELVVSESTRALLQVLARLGLYWVFRLFRSDEEALAYFGGTDGAAGVTARLIPVKPAGSAQAQPPESGRTTRA